MLTKTSPHLTTDQLFLCSSSASRKRLLTEAQIPFQSIPHQTDEEAILFKDSLADFVLRIAQAKEASVDRSFLEKETNTKKRFFFLSADTLVQGTTNKKIYAKPQNYQNAIEILQEIQSEPLLLATGTVLSGYQWNNNHYERFFYDAWPTETTLLYSLPTTEIECYLQKTPAALSATGAITVENEGAQYLAWINGSYSNVVGLPLFELQQRLRALHFVSQ
jgi:septum formation protein